MDDNATIQAICRLRLMHLSLRPPKQMPAELHSNGTACHAGRKHSEREHPDWRTLLGLQMLWSRYKLGYNRHNEPRLHGTFSGTGTARPRASAALSRRLHLQASPAPPGRAGPGRAGPGALATPTTHHPPPLHTPTNPALGPSRVPLI